MLLGYDSTVGATWSTRSTRKCKVTSPGTQHISSQQAQISETRTQSVHVISDSLKSVRDSQGAPPGADGDAPFRPENCGLNCDVQLRRRRSRTPRHRVFSETSTSENKPTHLLCSLVGEQCKFNGQAFQRLFEGPPRATVQSGPGGERGRVRP